MPSGAGPSKKRHEGSNDEHSDGEAVDDTAGGIIDDLDAMECGEIEQPPVRMARRTESIAHDDIVNGKIVYVHVDVEDGGPLCGLLQISAVILDAEINQIGQFNHYVKPPDNAIWNEVIANESHHLHSNHPKILTAMSINIVWPEFVREIERHINGDKVGMLSAWTGEGSDCSKLFHLMEASQWRDQLDMP